MLGVCPTGLLETDDWTLVSLEGAVREYGASYLQAHGYWPPAARLLEGFEVIRQVRNEIDARKWAKVKEQQKRGGNG